MSQTYRARFDKDPSALTLDVGGFKDGRYAISGAWSPEAWANLCDDLGLPPAGEGRADLTLDVRSPVVRVTGSVSATFKRNCVRSLENFMDSRTYAIDEILSLRPVDEEDPEAALYLDDGQLDVGDFLRQHVALNLDPYPVKPGGPERGSVIVDDGLGQTADTKNPFAALKQLKN
jgi:uncharacterized metal-binding protein YceD (DUF177 family)